MKWLPQRQLINKKYEKAFFLIKRYFVVPQALFHRNLIEGRSVSQCYL